MNESKISEIKYRFYESEQGLEEKQVELFNQFNQGPAATAEQLIARYKDDNIDPKTVRYAFDPNNKLISYIQARVRKNSKEVHIGFPWAIESCPSTIQDTLFDEMLAYIKDNYKEFKIRININTNPPENVTFIKKCDSSFAVFRSPFSFIPSKFEGQAGNPFTTVARHHQCVSNS